MRSYLPEYDLVTPNRLDEAITLLSSGEAWRPVAGGTDLMVLMNAGKLSYRRLVAVDELPELQGIRTTEDELVIGAAVRFSDIRENETLQEHFPLLCQAASWTGGWANQNRATLGGNVVNASPAADSPPALLVYDAELLVTSKAGSRWISYCDFHTGYKQLQMRPDELLVRVHLPWPPSTLKHYGRKVGTRKAQAISKVCLAATGKCVEGCVRHIHLAFGSVAAIPLRCVQTEQFLAGRILDDEVIDAACEVLKSEIAPISDIRSTAEYRSTVACNLLREFLRSLV